MISEFNFNIFVEVKTSYKVWIGLVLVKKEVWTRFFKGWQGCSEGFPAFGFPLKRTTPTKFPQAGSSGVAIMKKNKRTSYFKFVVFSSPQTLKK